MTIGWESGRSGCSLANWYDECYRTTPIAGSKRKLKKWTRAGPINERTYARLNGLTKRDLEPWMIKKMIKKKQLIDKHLYVSILKLKQNIFNCLVLDFKASNRNRDRKKSPPTQEIKSFLRSFAPEAIWQIQIADIKQRMDERVQVHVHMECRWCQSCALLIPWWLKGMYYLSKKNYRTV